MQTIIPLYIPLKDCIIKNKFSRPEENIKAPNTVCTPIKASTARLPHCSPCNFLRPGNVERITMNLRR